MTEILEAEVLDIDLTSSGVKLALSKDPTDVEYLESVMWEYARRGDQLMFGTLIKLIADMNDSIKRQERENRQNFQAIKDSLNSSAVVTEHFLYLRFKNNPELLEGFTVHENEEKQIREVLYEGCKGNILAKAIAKLKRKLSQYFGGKTIKKEFLFEAIKSFFDSLDDSEEEELDEETLYLNNLILTRAEYLFITKRGKKFSIPEIKQEKLLEKVETSYIRKLIEKNGWVYVPQGKSRTHRFTKKSYLDMENDND